VGTYRKIFAGKESLVAAHSSINVYVNINPTVVLPKVCLHLKVL
jgi:hypothetical protein